MSHAATRRFRMRDLVPHARLALIRIRQASPSLLSALVGLEIAAALAPAAFALAIGLVIRKAQSLHESVGLAGNEQVLLVPLSALGVISLLSALVLVARQYVLARLVDELRLDVSREVFAHLSTLDLEFFEDPASQNIVERATQQPGRDLVYFLVNVISIGTHSFQALSLSALLLYIEPMFTPVVFVAAIPWLHFRWRMAELTYETEREQTQTRRWSGYYAQTLAGRGFVPTVRMYRLAAVLLERYVGYLKRIIGVNRLLHRRQARGSAVASTVVNLAGIGLVIWVGIRASRGEVSLAALGTFVVAASRIEASINAFVQSMADSLQHALLLTNLSELMEQQPGIRGGTSTAPIRGEIELRNVYFTYHGSSEPVLHGVSMKLEAGSTVALLGPNGCGKTTITHLIARLYDVSEGAIYIDGQDLREYSLAHLRASMAFVSQNPVSFEATAAENIAFGDWERLAEAPDEIRRAASEVGIAELIERLPDGYNTQLGRAFGTVDLSGGQWQKLALARALARDAPILILDEPTASMDIRSEADMLRQFQRLSRGKTTLLISHHFSTVAMADHIYVMDEGRIVEHGTHRELRERGGTYATLYELHERIAMRAQAEAEAAS